MVKKFLDYSGLKKFKDYFKGDIKEMVKEMIGLDESSNMLKYAQNRDIDTDVLSDGETAGDNIVTVKNFAYYHKQLVNEIQSNDGELATSIKDMIADELVFDGSDDEKSEIYENVEEIVEKKMQWNGEFPE